MPKLLIFYFHNSLSFFIPGWYYIQNKHLEPSLGSLLGVCVKEGKYLKDTFLRTWFFPRFYQSKPAYHVHQVSKMSWKTRLVPHYQIKTFKRYMWKSYMLYKLELCETYIFLGRRKEKNFIQTLWNSFDGSISSILYFRLHLQKQLFIDVKKISCS